MAVPADVMHVRLVGQLEEVAGQPVEEFSFGFHGSLRHFTGNLTDWAANMQTLAEGVRDRWIEHVETSRFASAVVFTKVEAYHLEAGQGKVLDKGEAGFVDATAYKGTAGTSLPWEASIAVSLYGYTPGTFVPQRARRRGRFYLPPSGTVVMDGQTGKIATVARDNILGDMVDFLNDVQGLEFDDSGPSGNADYFELVVLSRANTATYPVTTVRVGRVVDAQRRRRKKQSEQYADGTVAHS